MKNWTGKRYWLVGASEGLGAALARILSENGAHLILSARDEGRLQTLADSLPGPAEVLALDVADSDAVAAAPGRVGDIDGVVYLAGVYWPMHAGNWNYDQANAMADVNFTGLVRIMGIAVPPMAARGSGHVVITGSLSGFRGLPNAIGYAASKAGTMALAECMYADLRRSGVDVQLVNPGFIRTRLTEKNAFHMPFIMEPEAAAKVMFDHMNTRRFSRSFPTGFSLLFRLSRFVPGWLYFRLFA